MQRLNVSLNPELAVCSISNATLRWSHHALSQANAKCVRLANTLTAPKGSVVEVELDGRRLTKAVVRLKATSGYDEVLVVVPLGGNVWKVVTCWTNSCNDLHSTLRTDRLGEVA